jgi:hypothetical protein
VLQQNETWTTVYNLNYFKFACSRVNGDVDTGYEDIMDSYSSSITHTQLFQADCTT